VGVGCSAEDADADAEAAGVVVLLFSVNASGHFAGAVSVVA
jgi:hypothetical protein